MVELEHNPLLIVSLVGCCKLVESVVDWDLKFILGLNIPCILSIVSLFEIILPLLVFVLSTRLVEIIIR